MRTLKHIENIECEDTMMRSAAGFSNEDREMVAQFNIQDLLPIGMVIVVFAIGIGYGLSVMDDVQRTMGSDRCEDLTAGSFNGTHCVNGTGTILLENGEAYDAVGHGITATAKFPSKLGLIVTVIIAAIVIGILVRYLFIRYG